MEQNHESEPVDSRKGITTSAVNAAVAFIILAIGAVVVYSGAQLGSGWTTDGPGAGYFPFYIGVILCVSGAATLFQSLRNKQKNAEIFVSAEQLKRVVTVLIPALFYVLGIQLVGIYAASTLYIALFMIVLGKYHWIKSVIVAFAMNALFFLMFEVWFKVPLYKGKFAPLSLLGY